MGCVYWIANDLSKRNYVGQTTQENYPYKRMARHCRDAARGSNFEFHKAIRSEGAGNFYVARVWKSSSQRCLNIVEKLWADALNCYSGSAFNGEYHGGYNMVECGQTNRMLGRKHTPAALAKISAARRKYLAEKLSTSNSEDGSDTLFE